MKLIFSHLFTEGNEWTDFYSLTSIGQEKMMANMQEITGLLSHICCKDHPYAIVPIITASVGGEMHNTFFVCCSQCKEILTRTLSYGRAHFQVVCLQPQDGLVITHP